MASRFPDTRAAALGRWQEFSGLAPQYGSARNAVVPGHPHVSRLSPAVSVGLVRTLELVEWTLARHPPGQVEKWVQELCWRLYWKGWLEMRPGVWRDWRNRVALLRTCLPEPVRERVGKVLSGESGVAIMDHFTRELLDTGYLHNHARMWWAAFWIHVERLPWELGADFFFRHLLDADAASNTLSWRWVAGLHTKGKPYLVRRSNLERYLDPALRVHAAGLEALADEAACGVALEDSADTRQVPLPDVATGLSPALSMAPEVGIWLHEEDLLAEEGPLLNVRPAALAGVVASQGFKEMGRRHQAHLRTALEDGVARAERHFACPAEVHDAHDGGALVIRNWVQRHRLRHVVAIQPWTGAVADELPGITAELKAEGCQLHLVAREDDLRTFAWAGSGFFRFWERMRHQLSLASPGAAGNLRLEAGS